MNFLWTDLQYAWRAARRSPGVTLAIIAMLALGTGGVTTVFNPLYSTLFAPLPYSQPEQLMLIGGNIPMFNILTNRFQREELDRFFINLASYATFPSSAYSISGIEKLKRVFEVDVSEDFFKTLGVMPLRGSDFDRSKTPRGVVISHRFWRNELMEEDDAIGKMILLSGLPYPIVGIMPESFDFPTGTDIWSYSGISATKMSNARQYLGRLRPGLSQGTVEEELRAIDLKPVYALVGKDGPILEPLQTVLYGDRRPMLLMLGSTAVLFLVLVCSGVMNLLITQGARRESEMALRLVLGATRRNLVFQLLRETLPLVIVGALAGLWISEISSAWLMARFPALKGGEVDVSVKMAFFAALVFAVTLIGGLIPALYAAGVNLNTYLKSGSNSRRRFLTFSISVRELLAGLQLSLALALTIGVGLLVSSMMFHVDVPLRWSSRDMVVVTAEFPVLTGINTPEAARVRALFFQELQHNLATMPEVASVGIFQPIPFSAAAERNRQSGTNGVHSAPSGPWEMVSVPAIAGVASPEGLEMLGVTLIAGRFFTSTEIASATDLSISTIGLNRVSDSGMIPVFGGWAIVNESLVRKLLPGENAVGTTIYSGLSIAYEIVGVVRDFHQDAYNRDYYPAVYYIDDWRRSFTNQTFIIKLHSISLMNDLRQRLSRIDSGPVTIELQSLWDIVSNATADMRMTLQLLGSFAVLGIVIAGLGVYATTSIMAASWNREMGIRMAMGAQTWDILRLALWRGTRAILFGLPIGLFLAWILSRTLSSYLFQVKVFDPHVWIISCALLLVITIIAAFIPALRLTRVNPMDALRNE